MIEPKVIFVRIYDGEGLFDIERDIWEALQEEYNSNMVDIPKDFHNFHRGNFTVSITWSPDETDE